MMMTKKKVLALAGVGVVAATLLCAVPAMAEGTLNQTFVKQAPGFNSNSWQDSHVDHNNTTVGFSACTYYNASGLQKSADVQLFDEQGLLPDQNVGGRSTTCGSMNFGEQTRSDGYHWYLVGLDGSTINIHQLSAKSAVAF